MEPDFSERLKNDRRAKAMTQQDLADQLGVSNKTVSRWESGGRLSRRAAAGPPGPGAGGDGG